MASSAVGSEEIGEIAQLSTCIILFQTAGGHCTPPGSAGGPVAPRGFCRRSFYSPPYSPSNGSLPVEPPCLGRSSCTLSQGALLE